MTLPADLYSPDQLSELIMELRSYIDALRDTALRNRATAASSSPAPTMSPLLRELFEGASGSMTPEEMLRELEALLKKAPIVHLIFPALPDKELKRQLILWFRVEVSPHTLLTVSERRDIGGGIVIRAGSRVYDFSFRRRILDNKHRLMEIASSV